MSPVPRFSMRCPHCGAIIDSRHFICPVCGVALNGGF